MTSDRRLWPPEVVVSAVLFVVLVVPMLLAFGAMGAVVLAGVLGTGVRVMAIMRARDRAG
jgi:hypothetical protein